MIYIAPKPTNESRAQYSPEPVWGSCQMHTMWVMAVTNVSIHPRIRLPPASCCQPTTCGVRCHWWLHDWWRSV